MSGEEKTKSIQEMATMLEGVFKKVIEDAKGTSDSDSKAFNEPIVEEKPSFVEQPSNNQEVKQLTSFSTYTFLDQMFLDEQNVPIVGLPFGSNNILTGLPNSGKSLLIMEIALKVSAMGKKVCFITSEEIWRSNSARYDLESRMKEKAKLLKINTDWETNFFVLDTVNHAELREWSDFVTEYRRLVEKEHIDLTLIDSMTLIEDTRGMLKVRLLELMRYHQTHGVTSVLVNQRAIEEADTLAMAGGIALSHIVDSVFVLDYKKVSSWDSQIKLDIPSAKQGQEMHFFRILKSRLCRFNAKYLGYEISQDGLIKLLPIQAELK